ncbi:MAG: sulfatase-like hydrolase/transferase [Opitutaceae bacterium]|nr:sulfatase-like hydrolase/transferase [Opitutaceae bacterium]
MNLRRILLAAALALVPAAALLPAASSSRPNIVIIIADDLGYGDIGCYGATDIPTPQLDRLARQGRRFTCAYAPASTCTPSRYALLSGEYGWRQPEKKTSILDGDAPLALDPARPTLATQLRKAGYFTGLIGKWHLGLGDGTHPIDFNGDIKPGPIEVGFDSAFFLPATVDRVPTVFIENHRVSGLDPSDPIRVSYQQRVNPEPTGAERPDLLKMGAEAIHSNVIVNGISRIGSMAGGRTARWVDEDIADLLARRSADFIEAHKSGPFFLLLGLHDPHVPHAPNARFVGKTKLGRRGDAIVQLDWTVGAVVAALERSGVADNTLVIFTSDNGPVLYDGYYDQSAELNGSHRPAGGLRGWKYLPYEGGLRIPFIARWPGHVKPGVDDRLLGLNDLYATLSAITGQPIATGIARDSIDQSRVLLGKRGPAIRTEIVEQAISNTLALRMGDWKLIPASPQQQVSGMGAGADPQDKRWTHSIIRADELYDLAKDPSESANLASRHPDRVAAMKARLQEIRQGD